MSPLQNSPSVVQLRTMEVLGQRCGSCEFFAYPRACILVWGEVLSDMVCELWKQASLLVDVPELEDELEPEVLRGINA